MRTLVIRDLCDEILMIEISRISSGFEGYDNQKIPSMTSLATLLPRCSVFNRSSMIVLAVKGTPSDYQCQLVSTLRLIFDISLLFSHFMNISTFGAVDYEKLH